MVLEHIFQGRAHKGRVVESKSMPHTIVRNVEFVGLSMKESSPIRWYTDPFTQFTLGWAPSIHKHFLSALRQSDQKDLGGFPCSGHFKEVFGAHGLYGFSTDMNEGRT